MKNKKLIISAVVTIVLALAGVFFGIEYTQDDVDKISEGVETVVSIIEENQSTKEIPEAYLEDEQALEEQEVEDEGFELQGEIAYNGSSELPNVQLGQYTGLTYYSQIDSRWKNKLYTSTGNSSQTMGSSACGPTCSAMVVSSIKGTILPTEMADLYVQYGFRSANNGTYWSAFRWTADVFDIGYKETIYLDEACKLLQDNYYLIVGCGNGLFTTGGHFIMLYDYDGTYIKVYDPYLYSGKFNLSTRRGKATVQGNTVLVTKDNFRNYANYGTFFAFKNDRTDTKEDNANVVTATYNRYVKVNTSLNVRSGPSTNYSIVGRKYNGDKVTVYKESSNWSNIGTNEWVSSDYLTDSNMQSISNTVGQYKKLKSTTTLYSNSNLTGTRYTYLKNTKVKILQNVSSTVDRIYVPATGRYAYIDNSAYGTTTSSGVNLTGQYKKFKSNTIIYSNSNLSGTKYYYLPKTRVKVIADYGNVNKIYVPATGRYGFVSENVY
uniref:SH3 domain protein n=1 Tax=Myoviridae sp. ct2Pw37 TaxID=2825021 RepID=A0A8S5PBL9_9CAUD|nr:MAG TPA: SH3 domain protein [Myoviridae sp. ct2Pw37]